MRTVASRVLRMFPKVKALLLVIRGHLAPSLPVSSNYQEIDVGSRDEESVRLVDSWKDELLPARQRALADIQLQNFRDRKKVDVFDVFIASLDAAQGLPNDGTLLEIGCSSGYYLEVLEIAGKSFRYRGCDYSEGFISLARSIYPDGTFDTEDATRLSYADREFDVVVSGCCLLHIPDYGKAIAEAARVAKDFVIFHRTPIVFGQQTKYFRKLAYGLETIEIHLSEEEFFSLADRSGLELLKTITLHETRDQQEATVGSANRTFIFRKCI